MKLYVDDIRTGPYGWLTVRTISGAIDIIHRYGDSISHVSLDHDISIPVTIEGVTRPYPLPETFTVVAHYLTAHYKTRSSKERPHVSVHSANPDGRKRIKEIFAEAGWKCDEHPETPANRLEYET